MARPIHRMWVWYSKRVVLVAAWALWFNERVTTGSEPCSLQMLPRLGPHILRANRIVHIPSVYMRELNQTSYRIAYLTWSRAVGPFAGVVESQPPPTCTELVTGVFAVTQRYTQIAPSINPFHSEMNPI